MPKIRGVHPDYWTDEAVVELSIPARLLFVGLWNFACDNGHLDDKPKQIKLRVLPGDAVDVEGLLSELADLGRIVRNAGTITIPNFAHHQKPNKRWWKTCDLDGCNRPEDTPQPEPNVGQGCSTPDVEVEVDGELKGSDGDRPAKPSATPKRGTQLPDTWHPNNNHANLVTELGIDGPAELAQFKDHHIAKGSTFKDWDRAFNTWLRNAKKFGSRASTTNRRQAETDDLFERAMQRAEAREAQTKELER